MKNGFTLIEVLIALTILAVVFSLIMPISYSMYNYYNEIREIEKIVFMISNVRRESFLYNKENVLYEKNGILYINERPVENFSFRFKINSPIIFFKNGTSSGGIIKIFKDNTAYKIEIYSPFGEIRYEKL